MELRYNKPLTNNFLFPIVKFMEKNRDITKPSYSEHCLETLSFDFVMSKECYKAVLKQRFFSKFH